MHHDAPQFIRYLVALTGGDPCLTQIPRGKHPLRIHTQRVGAVRLVTVAPGSDPLPEVDETALSPLVAAPGTVLLRGIIAGVRDTAAADRALWLTLPGAGAVPLVAADADIAVTLRGLLRRPVIVRGVCAAQGIVVHMVQAEVAP